MQSIPLTSTHHHQHRQSQHQYYDSRHPHHALVDTDLPFEYSSTDFSSSAIIDGLNSLVPDDALLADDMQSDAWGLAHYGHPSRLSIGRTFHQRESSLSSLGSAGPASPYSNNSTSNPHIAVTDSSSDGLADMHSHDATGSDNAFHYHLAKSVNGSFPGYQSLEPGMNEMAYPLAIPGPSSKPRADRGLLPAPDLSGNANRSHPASVASSIAGGDSPATPTVGEHEHMERRRREAYGVVPKLDRTMTDIYGDELYNPNFTITSTTPPTQPTMVAATSPVNDLFHQRLNAANIQHLSATHSPNSSSSMDHSSPFRMGSPLAPVHNDFSIQSQSGSFNTAQRMREQSKAHQDAQMLQQQMTRGAEPETPTTISPKDAILEFQEPEGDANFPLFAQDPTSFDMDQLAGAMTPQDIKSQLTVSMGHSAAPSQSFPYIPTQMGVGVHVPQQYPFISRSQLKHESPPRLSSAGSSSGPASGGNTPLSIARPPNTGADGGTYTCTYHGCTLRFETPALLQKHKREGHRQTHGLTAPRPTQDLTGMGSILNSQAGPHRCDRINPSTGKSCNTVFSRPYDLTRHEDTIHNARKLKVRCDICTEEKTFSRADALTRHFRVCHPELELPGKLRRRGGA